MTEDEFKRLGAEGYNRVPVAYQAVADLDTPLSAYLKLADRPGTFLLESVVGGERFGRYSYIGLAARTSLRASGSSVSVLRDGTTIEQHAGNPLDFARDFMKRYRAAAVPGLPHFGGGLVGYLGYDSVRWIEPRLGRGWEKPDTLGCPDMLLLLCEELAVFDNLTGKLHIIVYADPGQPGSYGAATHRLRELRGALRLPLDHVPDKAAVKGELRCNFTEPAFKSAVARAKRYIEDGDAM
jgi:anthranilate synthase component 1